MQTLFKIELEFPQTFFFTSHVLDDILNVAQSKVAILSGLLSYLVAFDWVPCCCDLLRGLASKKIIDGEDFIEELELLFSFFSFLLIKVNSIKLKKFV